ncbi:hypothetical protein FQZ97_1091080 [compost metagenome]
MAAVLITPLAQPLLKLHQRGVANRLQAVDRPSINGQVIRHRVRQLQTGATAGKIQLNDRDKLLVGQCQSLLDLRTQRSQRWLLHGRERRIGGGGLGEGTVHPLGAGQRLGT